MVVVSIELWPHGDQKRARPLGVALITNDGTGDKVAGNYEVKLSHSGKYIKKPGAYKTGTVKNHRRSLSVYHLIYKALKACIRP